MQEEEELQAQDQVQAQEQAQGSEWSSAAISTAIAMLAFVLLRNHPLQKAQEPFGRAQDHSTLRDALTGRAKHTRRQPSICGPPSSLPLKFKVLTRTIHS